jgi:hypothetical protein
MKGVFYEGKSQRQVAEELGLPPATANDAYHRVIRDLARCLAEYRESFAVGAEQEVDFNEAESNGGPG